MAGRPIRSRSVLDALVVLLLVALATSSVVVAQPPNVVVLLMDDLGYGDLPSFGSRLGQAPNIEALLAAGTRFTQWYSASSVCSPSRAALLTGRLPVRYGMAGATWAGGVLGANAEAGLPDNETTLATLLHDNGYATMQIGKWHLGQRDPYLPTRRGFDAYYGIPFSNDMAATRLMPDPNPNGCTALPLLANETIIEQPVDLATITSRYTDEAIKFVSSSATVKRPFYLHIGYHDVHIPHACTTFCGASRLGPFGDALLEADDSVRRIVSALAEAGVSNNTIIYFASDNGPWLITGDNSGSAGPLRGGKGTTWEGGIRVPAGVVWPGHVPAGRVSSEPISMMDIFTTTLALAGIAPPSDRIIDGKDQSALFLGTPNATSPWETLFFYEGTPQTTPTERPGLWAVLHGPYKAHFVTTRFQYWIPRFHDPPLLYNLDDDIAESTELDPVAYADVLAEIAAAVRAHEAELVVAPNVAGGDPQYCLCCDPASQDRYPQYPACTCNPENW